MRLYFVRHGESEANVLGVISNRGYQHGLTEKGRQQALSLGQNLKDAAIMRIYSSPLMRAVQTAETLTECWGVGYTVTPALREYDCGVLEDKADPESWAVHRSVSQDWFQHRNWESRAEGGESFLDIKARFLPFIDSLIRQFGHTDEQVALVGHGGLYHAMLPLALTNVDFEFALAHGMTNTGYVVADLRAEGLVCAEWCKAIIPPVPPTEGEQR